MDQDQDNEVLSVIEQSIKQLTIPVAMFAAAYGSKNFISIELAGINIGEILSFIMSLFGGYFTAMISFAAGDNLSKLDLPKTKLYCLKIMLIFLHIILVVLGVTAALDIKT